MKNLKTIAIALLITVSAAITAQTKKVDVSKSSVNWNAKKVTGEHSGTVNLKEGALVFKKTKLAGGNFVIDMTSINTTDLSGDGKTSLDGHLKSDDFFGTEKNPTATLVFKKIAVKAAGVYTVTGNLTIKGITSPVSFDLATTANTAATTLKIDRTKFGIKYGSGSFFDNLGDKAISNEFELKVALVF
jgi:polyisoprenoid-binding protein YceI